jgi:mono/diheme cytochrome c family protein
MSFGKMLVGLSAVRLAGVIIVGLVLSAAALTQVQAQGAPQAPLSAEQQRLIDFGKEIFKTEANCQFCHGWDGAGGEGYGGNALSLRVTKLSPDEVRMTVQCGRPGTGMPYHDQFAYTDKRCYGMDKAAVGDDIPPIGSALSKNQIDAVVAYVFAKVVGKGDDTYDQCVDFWGPGTQTCDPYKKK